MLTDENNIPPNALNDDDLIPPEGDGDDGDDDLPPDSSDLEDLGVDLPDETYFNSSIVQEDFNEISLTPPPDPHTNPVEFLEAAFERLKDDVGVLAEEDVIQAFVTLRGTDMPGYLRFRSKAKRINRLASLHYLDQMIRSELPQGVDDPSQIDELVALGMKYCQLHHDADERGVAVIPKLTHREVWRVTSPGYQSWLRAEYWKESHSGISDTTLNAALATLNAAGVNEGKLVTVPLRAACQENAYYIDLCDRYWQVIEISENGWAIRSDSPALFTRTQSMRSLPEPQCGAEIDLLWKHINIPPERRLLVLAWLIESLRPDTPFPVLELVGEQGSAKSTTQSVLRSLIDPNKVMLRGRPKAVEDIFVAAANNWVVSYENLSSLTAEQQDALCTLSTGGGFAARQLYTNGEEHVLETKRPVMLNGISVIATRPDLIDRVVHIDMPVIDAARRKEDSETRSDWERDRPMVFAALLDLFVRVLGVLPTIKLTHKQRMADFERLGEAVAQVLGYPIGSFQAQYAEHNRAGIDRALDGNPVAQVLDKFISERLPDGIWQGTAGQLYDQLNAEGIADKTTWPKSPKGLADQLRRLAPAYRAKGIEVIHQGHSREGALWRISAEVSRQSPDQLSH